MRTGRAGVEDAPEILALQKLAFTSQAELYDDPSMPPMTQSLEGLRGEFSYKLFLKATKGGGTGEIVGSVRAFEREGTCSIERLIVLPGFEGRGIGTSLMRDIEGEFPAASRYELFTGHKSRRNLRLYKHLGYRPYREEVVDASLTLVFMEKPG